MRECFSFLSDWCQDFRLNGYRNHRPASINVSIGIYFDILPIPCILIASIHFWILTGIGLKNPWQHFRWVTMAWIEFLLVLDEWMTFECYFPVSWIFNPSLHCIPMQRESNPGKSINIWIGIGIVDGECIDQHDSGSNPDANPGVSTRFHFVSWWSSTVWTGKHRECPGTDCTAVTFFI